MGKEDISEIDKAMEDYIWRMRETLDECLGHLRVGFSDPEIKKAYDSVFGYLAKSLTHDACAAIQAAYKMGKESGGE